MKFDIKHKTDQSGLEDMEIKICFHFYLIVSYREYPRLDVKFSSVRVNESQLICFKRIHLCVCLMLWELLARLKIHMCVCILFFCWPEHFQFPTFISCLWVLCLEIFMGGFDSCVSLNGCVGVCVCVCMCVWANSFFPTEHDKHHYIAAQSQHWINTNRYVCSFRFALLHMHTNTLLWCKLCLCVCVCVVCITAHLHGCVRCVCAHLVWWIL